MSSHLLSFPKIKKHMKISELNIDKHDKTYLFDSFIFFFIEIFQK